MSDVASSFNERHVRAAPTAQAVYEDGSHLTETANDLRLSEPSGKRLYAVARMACLRRAFAFQCYRTIELPDAAVRTLNIGFVRDGLQLLPPAAAPRGDGTCLAPLAHAGARRLGLQAYGGAHTPGVHGMRPCLHLGDDTGAVQASGPGLARQYHVSTSRRPVQSIATCGIHRVLPGHAPKPVLSTWGGALRTP